MQFIKKEDIVHAAQKIIGSWSISGYFGWFFNTNSNGFAAL